jgi:xanthine dehydrogenase YagR molybdenum-binding subunit
VRLGADPQGKLLAYLHEGWELPSRPDNYNVAGTSSTAVMLWLWRVVTKVNVANVDPTPGIHAPPWTNRRAY